MNITYICSEYSSATTGGIGTFTKDLAEELAARGHCIHVVGLYNTTAASSELVNGVHVYRIPQAPGLRGAIVNRWALWRKIKLIELEFGPPDILEAPDFEGITAWIPRCSKFKVIRLHGSHRYFSDERRVGHSAFISLCEKVALKQADSILSVSEYTARRTRELFGLSTKILTVHNAVNVQAHHPRKTDYQEQKRAVYFGTLAEKKGVLALAEAWRGFRQSHPDWRLAVIGRDASHAGGSVKAAMLTLLGEAALSVDFSGFIPNDQVLSRLASYDFAILPSFSEAFALAPMEAMALGLPVIYSSMSSGPELITDGVNGWLCDPRSVDNLTATLCRAASDPAERARLGLAARRLIETRFSYDDFVSRNIAFYESVLSEQKSTR